MERKIQSRAFAGAAETLGIEDRGALTTIELGGATPVVPMDSYASNNLTIEDVMVARATSVAAAGFEGFPFFDMEDVAHPENAWLMDLSAITVTGSPTGAMVNMGAGTTGGGHRLVMHWDATINPGVGGVLWLQDGLPTLPMPLALSHFAPTVAGTPSIIVGDTVTAFHMEIDPAAIGNIIDFSARVRSAPRGVRVWGTW